MAFPEHLKSLYVAAGIDTSSIFLGTKAEIPTQEGPYISIVETPSFSPEFVQGEVLPCYVYAAAQVFARASARTIASVNSRICWTASFVWNQTISGVWYRNIQ